MSFRPIQFDLVNPGYLEAVIAILILYTYFVPVTDINSDNFALPPFRKLAVAKSNGLGPVFD